MPPDPVGRRGAFGAGLPTRRGGAGASRGEAALRPDAGRGAARALRCSDAPGTPSAGVAAASVGGPEEAQKFGMMDEVPSTLAELRMPLQGVVFNRVHREHRHRGAARWVPRTSTASRRGSRARPRRARRVAAARSERHRRILADASETFGLSAISLWEVGKKHQLCKLPLDRDLEAWFHHAIAGNVHVLPLTPEIVAEAMRLPAFPTRDLV